MQQKIKILVVDDEESLCELMAEILAEEYEVFKAFNGKEALMVAKKYQPDLIISDIMMPQMTGLELVEALRQTEQTRQIPIILLSAAVAPPKEIQQEVAAFVSKPFEIEQLESLVTQAMQKAMVQEQTDDSNTHAPQLSEVAPERAFRFDFNQTSNQMAYPRYGDTGMNYEN